MIPSSRDSIDAKSHLPLTRTFEVAAESSLLSVIENLLGEGILLGDSTVPSKRLFAWTPGLTWDCNGLAD